MRLYGVYKGLRDGVAHFGDNLQRDLDGADAVITRSISIAAV